MAGRQTSIQQREKRAGLILIGSAAVALIAANSSAASAYQALLDWPIGPALPRSGVLDVRHWVADGLMAIFFLLVGLEVKREWLDGRLSTPAERRLPFIAAAAGMAVPALFFLAVIGFDPALARGWAIPSATDIAFAVGILALLGARSNPSIKLLLVAIAVIDDVGAVLIIALVYAAKLDGLAIGCGIVILFGMAALNRFGMRRLWPYMIGFALLWLAMLASGIHATIAGVLTALLVPRGKPGEPSPLKRLEHNIHPWVMFGIMPLFGLVSAGVALGSPAGLAEPLPLAILAGLFLGKQAGVFGAIWLADRTRVAPRPENTSWSELYGTALLCGVGFTMSLFIGALAFPGAPDTVNAAKIGTLAGSLLSAVAGWAVLRFAARSQFPAQDREQVDAIFADRYSEGGN